MRRVADIILRLCVAERGGFGWLCEGGVALRVVGVSSGEQGEEEQNGV